MVSADCLGFLPSRSVSSGSWGIFDSACSHPFSSCLSRLFRAYGTVPLGRSVYPFSPRQALICLVLFLTPGTLSPFCHPHVCHSGACSRRYPPACCPSAPPSHLAPVFRTLAVFSPPFPFCCLPRFISSSSAFFQLAASFSVFSLRRLLSSAFPGLLRVSPVFFCSFLSSIAIPRRLCFSAPSFSFSAGFRGHSF